VLEQASPDLFHSAHVLRGRWLWRAGPYDQKFLAEIGEIGGDYGLCHRPKLLPGRHGLLPPFILDNELRVFASRSRCKNSVGLNAVGAEGSATAHGNFSRERALEATTENRWKVLGFALVAIARLEIAGAAPMDFVSRRQSGSLAAPGQTDARHGRGMHGLGGRIGRQSCTSWSLGPLRGELADEH